MIGRIAFYLQQPSKYSYVQLRLVLNSYVWIYVSVSPQSRNATTATSQVIVLTKRHFLALSFQAPLKAENSYILVRMERLELSRREAQVPKTCVSTIPPHPLIMVPQRGFEPRTYWLQISCSTNWAIAALFGAGKENRTPVLRLEICDNTIILYPRIGFPATLGVYPIVFHFTLRQLLTERS